MNPLLSMLTKHNINSDEIQRLLDTLKTDKLAALGVISSWGIPPEEIQSLMGQIMMNPALLEEAVEALGLSMEDVLQAKEDFSKN